MTPERGEDLRWEARRWIVAEHPYALHLLRAEDWARTIDPKADEAVLLAALLHDYERAVPDRESRWTVGQWGDPSYLRYHQDRSADLAVAWLATRGAEPALRLRVAELIRTHEVGGTERDRNVVQAADSLSFLETNGGMVAAWIADSRVDPDSGYAKVQWMHDRILLDDERTRDLAIDLLASCLAELPPN
jgi:hypothetical protein